YLRSNTIFAVVIAVKAVAVIARMVTIRKPILLRKKNKKQLFSILYFWTKYNSFHYDSFIVLNDYTTLFKIEKEYFGLSDRIIAFVKNSYTKFHKTKIPVLLPGSSLLKLKYHENSTTL